MKKRWDRPISRVKAVLIPIEIGCPIFDDQSVLGNLWLFRAKEKAFEPLEIQLAEQAATQCAIAIRQTRLYQAAQAQFTALEKHDRLKTEFLNILSHELRTPITNICLAVQTLETIMEQTGLFKQGSSALTQLFHVLHHEWQRQSQSKLVNDLLTLTYLDAENPSIVVDVIDLQTWLPAIVYSFADRVHSQQQQIYVLLRVTASYCELSCPP